jgi:hypothetical protein
VATIFWAMMALLPIPVTTNLPVVLYMISTVLTKSSFTKSTSFAMASLSDNMVFWAEAKMVSFGIKIQIR